MASSIGGQLGPYRVVALIGVGAMGEVYRAHDPRLGRDVAIKVVPPELRSDADRLARFEREARVLAALNHPNIAVLHGIENTGAELALVMELVDGETLDALLVRRARAGHGLPAADALEIARQIAAALEAAHAKGIVHRDLKPANVKVNSAGVVKVLDFGLAKIAAPQAAQPPELTLAAAATHSSAILGTAAYMSPEQARGFPVDHSADVWALACVLYELLSGERAFPGATVSDTIAAVLEHEPDWTKLPGTVPATARRLLRRCLHKEPAQRLRDISAARILIEDAQSAAEYAFGPEAPHAERRGRRWAAAGVAAITLIGLGGYAALRWTDTEPPREPLRLSVWAPGPITPQLSGAISPDGRHLAFVATGPSGRPMLWVRPLNSLDARELPGTERAAHPFWAPDSASLGFVADAKLKRVDLPSGAVRVLADASSTWRSGAAWSTDGVIVFSPRPDELAAVPAGGGEPNTVVRADPAKGELRVHWPDFLPDGRRFLFYKWSTERQHNGVFVGSLDSAETHRVLESDVRAKYAAPGYLLYLRDETLLARSFDTERLELFGDAYPIAEGVWFARGGNHASFSVSQNGILAYVNSTFFDRQLVWFDRSGRRIGAAGPVFRNANTTPQLGPDGRRIVIARGEEGLGDLWMLEEDAPTRLTFGAENRGVPIWSSDGTHLLYRNGRAIVRLDLAGGAEDTLLEADFQTIADWSADGRYIVLSLESDLWVVDLLGDRRPTRYLATTFNETQAQISPDGAWLAYTSNETGRDEIYVQSFPTAGRKRQISTDGGAMPRWRRDGAELVYLAADQTMTAVPISDLASLELGRPASLFRAPLLVQGSESIGIPTSYDVRTDGERFLLLQPPDDPAPPMTVVLHWDGALPR